MNKYTSMVILGFLIAVIGILTGIVGVYSTIIMGFTLITILSIIQGIICLALFIYLLTQIVEDICDCNRHNLRHFWKREV